MLKNLLEKKNEDGLFFLFYFFLFSRTARFYQRGAVNANQPYPIKWSGVGPTCSNYCRSGFEGTCCYLCMDEQFSVWPYTWNDSAALLRGWSCLLSSSSPSSSPSSRWTEAGPQNCVPHHANVMLDGFCRVIAVAFTVLLGVRRAK